MRKRILLLIAGACVATGISSCHSGGAGPEAIAATIPLARVAAAQRGDISHMLTLAGPVSALSSGRRAPQG